MHTPTNETEKTAANPMPHATREEMNQRLGIIRLWRVEGMSRQEIKQQTIALWKVCPRTAQLYLRKMEAGLTRHASRGDDELLNLQLSQLMRDRVLQELNRRLLGAFNVDTKELIQLANAVRTLLDARDRTVRAMHLLRGEKEDSPKREPAEPLPETGRGERRTAARGKAAVKPKPMLRAPGVEAARNAALSHDSPRNQPECKPEKALRAAEDRAAPSPEPAPGPHSPVRPEDRDEFLKAMQLVEEAESILRGRTGPADPLERILRDAQAADALPALAAPTPKSNRSKEMPFVHSGEGV